MISRGTRPPSGQNGLRALLVTIAAAVALSCSDTPVEVRTPETPQVRIDSLYDFFPPLSVGDTLSWRYTMYRSQPAELGSNYQASGTMRWTITGRSSANEVTTLRVSGSFTGTVTTYTNGVPSTEEFTAFPLLLTITEGPIHLVDITVPAGELEPWYIPPQAQFPRYRSALGGGTLVHAPSSTTSILARKDIGPVEITYAVRTEYARYERMGIPADTVIVPPPAEVVDIYPSLAVGDTMAWDYASTYASVVGPGYRVQGIMRWTVLQSTTGASGTTTTIMQRLSAVWTRWTTSTPETTLITNDTTYVSIGESPEHLVCTRIPLVWQGSPYRWEGSLQTWEITAPRYISAGITDTVIAFAGTATYRASVVLRKRFGPIRFTYNESYLSTTSTTMTRRTLPLP